MKPTSIFKYALCILTMAILAACSGGANSPTSSSNQSQVALAVKFATPATAGKAAKAAAPTVGPSDSLLLEITPVNPADVTPASIDLKPYLQSNGQGSITIPNLTDNATYYFKISLWSYNGTTSVLSWVGSNKVTLGGAGSSTDLSLTAYENLNGMYETAKPTYYAASLLSRGNPVPMLQFQVEGTNVSAAQILNSPNASTFTINGNTPTFTNTTLGTFDFATTHPNLYNDGQHWDYASNDRYWRLRLSSTTGISGNYAFGIQYTNAFGQPEYLNTVAAPGVDYTQTPVINTPAQPVAGTPLTISWNLPTNSAPNDFTQLNVTYWNNSTSIFRKVSLPITTTSYQIPGSDLIAGDNLIFSVTIGRANSSAWAYDSTGLSVPGTASAIGTPTLLASGYKSFVLDTSTANTVYHLNNNTTGVPYALVNTGAPQALTANAASDNAPLALARGTNGYLIAWAETSGPNYLIMGRLLDNSGVPTGTPFTIDSSTQSQEGPINIAFDGANYLVVWPQLAPSMTTINLVGRYVNTSASVVNSVTIASGIGIENSDFSLIFAAGSYFAVYTDGSSSSFNYYIKSISPAGALSPAVQLNSTVSKSSEYPSSIGFDGTNLLVIIPIFTIDNTIGHLYARRVSTALVPQGAETPIATGTTSKFGGWPSFDGTNFLIAYTDFGTTSATVYGQRISTAGVLVGSPFVIANNAAFGRCSYSSASSQYQCIYHTYSTYVQSVQSMFANINNLYGVTVQPWTGSTGSTTGGVTVSW